MRLSYSPILLFRILRRICRIVVLAIVAYPMVMYAAPPTPSDINSLSSQQNQIIEQQEQERRERLREQFKKEPPRRKEEYQQWEAPGKGGKEKCVDIDRVEIRGAKILSESKKQKLISLSLPQCIPLSEIDALIKRITNWYMDQGYVTTRAYLTPQDVSSRTLVITVIEGRVGAMNLMENGKLRAVFDDHLPSDRSQKLQAAFEDNAFPHLSGKTLNLRDIEQGLDQINRLKRYDATVQLDPGKEAGETTVNINTPVGQPVFVSTSIDNSGIPSTGRLQGDVQVEFDNILGWYDSWTLDAKHDLEQNVEGVMSRSLAGYISIPYGYWTARWSTSMFDYQTTLAGLNQSFNSTGTSTTNNLELDRVIHRDGESKTSLTGGITLRDTRNYVEGEFISTSSRKLSFASLTLSDNRRLGDAVVNLSLTVDQGLHMLGAVKDGYNLSDTSPRAQFQKYEMDAGVLKPLSLWGQSLAFDSKLHGQWSPDTLYSTERLSLGGIYTVRGFRSSSISGDSGVYIRNELQWNLEANKSGGFPVGVQPYAAMDGGWIKPDGSDATERGNVKGVGAGIRFNAAPSHQSGKNFFPHSFNAELSWERAIDAPYFIRTEGNIYYFRVGALL